MKLFLSCFALSQVLSLPSRGAWIEIGKAGKTDRPDRSLPSRGAWIEISNTGQVVSGGIGRSPHGERGLK